MVTRTHLVARSISRSVQDQLCQLDLSSTAGSVWRVLGVCERACNLVTANAGVVALVLPEIGDGPLNLVIHGGRGIFAGIQPDTPASLEGQCLHIDPATIFLDKAKMWEPCPPWERLARRDAITDRFPLLQALALRYAPEDSLMALLRPERSQGSTTWPPKVRPTMSPAGVILATAQEAAEHLRADWESDPVRLQTGATRLAGLGGGLTPAGDDFLVGVMLWAWLAHPAPERFCEVVLEASASCTTTLSAAFLRAAAAGECSAAWHRLLAALESGTKLHLGAAVQAVVSYGHSSGADALAGFLWMGSQPIQELPAQSL